MLVLLSIKEVKVLIPLGIRETVSRTCFAAVMCSYNTICFATSSALSRDVGDDIVPVYYDMWG